MSLHKLLQSCTVRLPGPPLHRADAEEGLSGLGHQLFEGLGLSGFVSLQGSWGHGGSHHSPNWEGNHDMLQAVFQDPQSLKALALVCSPL